MTTLQEDCRPLTNEKVCCIPLATIFEETDLNPFFVDLGGIITRSDLTFFKQHFSRHESTLASSDQEPRIPCE